MPDENALILTAGSAIHRTLMNLELFWIWIADKIRHCTWQHAVWDWRAGFCACNTSDVCSNVDSVTNYPDCNRAKNLKATVWSVKACCQYWSEHALFCNYLSCIIHLYVSGKIIIWYRIQVWYFHVGKWFNEGLLGSYSLYGRPG